MRYTTNSPQQPKPPNLNAMQPSNPKRQPTSSRALAPLALVTTYLLDAKAKPTKSIVCLLVALFFVGLPRTSLGQVLTAGTIEVSVSGFGGKAIQGSLLAADANKLTIQTSNGLSEKLASDVSLVSFSNNLDEQKQPVEVTLLDGSRAFGDKIVGNSSGWKLLNSSGQEIAFAPKSMRAARLKTIPKELADAWQTAVKELAETDAVIVLRAGESIDRINGIIVQVQESNVSFELDGQQIEIPIEKLVGLVWFQRATERVRPAIEITTTNHSVWMAESFSVKSSVLELTSPLGQMISLPLSKISSINYSSSNIRWLSDLEIIEATAAKRIDFKSSIPSLERSLAPRFVVNGRTPTAASPSGDKDLYFPSPGRFVFRAPEGFTTFQCQVQRTDEGTQRTDLSIEVWQDDQRISQQAFAFDQDAIEVKVPIQAGKKVILSVACESKLMIGTEVQWKQPILKR